MGTFVSICLGLMLTVYNPSAINLVALRVAYQQASSSEERALALLAELEKDKSKNSTLEGYRGAVTMMLAKFQLNPISKLSYFNNGKTILEAAIAKDPDNIELVFIRHTVQCNAPSFLQYNNKLSSDKQQLLVELKYVKDADLKNRILQFLKSSPYLTHAERSNLP